MGRIKTTLIKRTGRKIAEEDCFNNNFNFNKKLLNKTMPSKKIRNMVAGYITRLKQMKATKQKVMLSNSLEIKQQ